MKITMRTKDPEVKAELSLDWYDDREGNIDLIFGLDTPHESVSLALTVEQAEQFAKAINFLVKNIPEN